MGSVHWTQTSSCTDAGLPDSVMLSFGWCIAYLYLSCHATAAPEGHSRHRNKCKAEMYDACWCAVAWLLACVAALGTEASMKH